MLICLLSNTWWKSKGTIHLAALTSVFLEVNDQDNTGLITLVIPKITENYTLNMTLIHVSVLVFTHYNLYPMAPFSYIMFKTLTGPVGFSDTKYNTGHFTEKNLSSLARNEKVRKKTE